MVLYSLNLFFIFIAILIVPFPFLSFPPLSPPPCPVFCSPFLPFPFLFFPIFSSPFYPPPKRDKAMSLTVDVERRQGLLKELENKVQYVGITFILSTDKFFFPLFPPLFSLFPSHFSSSLSSFLNFFSLPFLTFTLPPSLPPFTILYFTLLYYIIVYNATPIFTCSLVYLQVIQVEAEHERWVNRYQTATEASQRQQRSIIEREKDDRDKVYDIVPILSCHIISCHVISCPVSLTMTSSNHSKLPFFSSYSSPFL